MIDQKWIDHLHEMDALREGIGLRAYGQKDPLIEYKRESRELFQEMMGNIRTEVITNLFHMQVQYDMPQSPQMVSLEDLPPELLQQLLAEAEGVEGFDLSNLEGLEISPMEEAAVREEEDSKGRA